MTEVEQTYTAFESLARIYCATLTTQKVVNLVAVQDCLLELYLAATRLPPVVLAARNRTPLPHPVTHAEWQALYKQLGQTLPFESYRDTFDPLSQEDDQVVLSGLADDLADIWRDMATGLRILEAQSAAAAQHVWWEWHFSFYTHWGAHAIGALRAIYHFRRDQA